MSYNNPETHWSETGILFIDFRQLEKAKIETIGDFESKTDKELKALGIDSKSLKRIKNYLSRGLKMV